MKPDLNIAMIEDSPAHCQQLQTTLNQWAKEQFVTLHTSVFTDCASCTLDKMLSFDVIFLDIELPDGSGLTLAQSSWADSIIILVRSLYYLPTRIMHCRDIAYVPCIILSNLSHY